MKKTLAILLILLATLASCKNMQTFTVNGVSFNMIRVQGGRFNMGAQSDNLSGTNYDSKADSDEGPVHSVRLRTYFIGETEVTQELWQAVMGSNPSCFTGDSLPVEQVSWVDVQNFLLQLNRLTGRRFRLPAESEWEYAARGGKKSHDYKYSGSDTIANAAWYRGNSDNHSHPVKTKSANELGLYDMSGNVWEWCQDWYDDYSSDAQTTPTKPSEYSVRVHRGGSWCDLPGCCRVSYRGNYGPNYGDKDLGFRLLLR